MMAAIVHSSKCFLCLTHRALLYCTDEQFFAKIWRVKKIMDSARRFRRAKIRIRDVVAIMVVMLTVEVAILLTWQLVNPLKWEREVLDSDFDGFPTKSVGSCQMDSTYALYAFLLPLVVFKFGCLLYALILCYITRKVPHEFSEGTWITASIVSLFQILLLALPVLFIVKDDSSALFFVRSGIVFLMTATITLLMFAPKAYSLHFKKTRDPNEQYYGGSSVMVSGINYSTTPDRVTFQLAKSSSPRPSAKVSKDSDVYSRDSFNVGSVSELRGYDASRDVEYGSTQKNSRSSSHGANDRAPDSNQPLENEQEDDTPACNRTDVDKEEASTEVIQKYQNNVMASSP